MSKTLWPLAWGEHSDSLDDRYELSTYPCSVKLTLTYLLIVHDRQSWVLEVTVKTTVRHAPGSRYLPKVGSSDYHQLSTRALLK
jgi:hypothetical protein